jgi:hypothetical protein
MSAYDGAGWTKTRTCVSPARCYQEGHRALQEDKHPWRISSGRLQAAHAATQNCCSVAIEFPPLMCGVIDNSSTDASIRSTR